MRALRRLLWPKRIRNEFVCDEPIITDAISESKHLQHSIITMTESMNEEHEEVCIKHEEADEVLESLQKKASAQIKDGKLHAALHNLNISLAMQQKIYGQQHPKVAGTLNTMGEVLSNMGEEHRYMAMSSFEQSLAILQEFEPGSKETATTLKNLWMLLHQTHVEISVGPDERISFEDFSSCKQVGARAA